jgi:hypothetical protein
LGEVTSRGRTIDGGAIGLLLSAFQQLIRNTVQRGLAEAKRVFSIPGVPTDEMKKAYVKGSSGIRRPQLLAKPIGSYFGSLPITGSLLQVQSNRQSSTMKPFA